MFEIKSHVADYAINFPTSLEELTPDILHNLVKAVELPENYAIICLASKVKLFDFVMAIDRNKDTNITVVPLLANINTTVEDIINHLGDKVIVDRTDIERGYHLNIPTMILYDNAAKYIKADRQLINEIIGFKKDSGIDSSTKIIVLSFKIIPVCDIRGYVPVNHNVDDPFIIEDKD